jgi:hypothetical protein
VFSGEMGRLSLYRSTRRETNLDRGQALVAAPLLMVGVVAVLLQGRCG